MSYVLMLAESPPKGVKISNAFAKTSRKKGYIEAQDPSILGGQKVFITWAVGHLLELAKPEYYSPNFRYSKELRGWPIEQYPVFPDKFVSLPRDDTKDQLKTIGELAKKASEIVIATDPGRAGENIAVSIFKHLGYEHKITKRLWNNSMEATALAESLRNLRDAKETYGYYLEDEARQRADWLIGMNFSPLFSTLTWRAGLSTSVMPLGRVMTPTGVGLVYRREKEIEDFVPQAYYMDELHCRTDDGIEFVARRKSSFPERGLIPVRKKTTAEVTDLSTTRRTKSPKELDGLLNVSLLQQRCGKLFGYSSDKTLELAQSLYDPPGEVEGYITYPRSEDNTITNAEFSYLLEHHSSYAKLAQSVGIEANLVNNKPRKPYVDPNTGEHHAIIPTRKIPDLNRLSAEQKRVYLVVLFSVLGIFEADYAYDKTILELDGEYVTEGIVDAELGWKKFFKKTAREDQLPPLSKGMTVQATQQVREEFTTPPPYLNHATIIEAMEDVHKFADDGDSKKILKSIKGIGTAATRHEAPKKLIRYEYLYLEGEGKRARYRTTPKGKLLAQIVLESCPLIGQPEMTAEWEKDLEAIRKRELDPEIFIQKIKDFIVDVYKTLPSSFGVTLSKIDTSSFVRQNQGAFEAKHLAVPCPSCGNKMADVDNAKLKAYVCESKCGQKPLWKNGLDKFGKKKISLRDAEKLLKGQQVPMKLKGQKGPFEAPVWFEKETGYVNIDFSKAKNIT